MAHFVAAFVAMLPALPPVADLAPVSARLGEVLVASTWQGLLLTAGVAAVLRLWPGLSAAARTVLWTAVLLLVVVLPALPLVMAGHRAPAATAGALHVRATLSFGLVALWAAASMFRLVQLLMSAARLRGMLRRAEVVPTTASLQALLVCGRRRVALCRSDEVDRPSVAGFLRPRVLFPPELLAKLSEAELRQVVLHEMEHLRRGDDWVNLLQQVSLVLLPLNPALLWLNRRLSLERELACDDRVLATTRARKAYAACLARVAESTLLRRGASLVLGVLGGFGARRPELVTRVERILRMPTAGMGRVQTRLATGGVMAGLLLGAVALAHSPQLVAFGPAPVAVASAAGEPMPAASWAVLPASAGARGPRMVTARATVTAAGVSATAVRPAVFNRTGQQHGVRRARAPRRSATMRPRMTVLTMWQPVPETQAVPAVARVRRAMIRVGIGDSQVWYTAVAWRDGWLVVQL